MIICQDLPRDKNAYLCRFKSQSLSLCQPVLLPISDVSVVNSHFLLIGLYLNLAGLNVLVGAS